MPSERHVWKTYVPFVGMGPVRWAQFELTPRIVWWGGHEWHLVYPTNDQMKNGTGIQYNPSRQLLLPCVQEDEVEIDPR